MSIWRTLSSAALLAAISLPTGARAQHPDRLVDDGGRFRGVLRPAGNAILVEAGDAQPVRFRTNDSSLLLVEGMQTTWSPADEALPFETRLLAGFLSTDDLDDAFAALGFQLDETVLGMELFDDALAGEIAVHRIGGSHAWVRLEPGIARPRSFTIVSGNQTYEVRANAYGDAGNGWYPTETAVLVDGRVVLEFSVTDLAPTTGDLSPLTQAATPSRPAIDLPRLPL